MKLLIAIAFGAIFGIALALAAFIARGGSIDPRPPTIIVVPQQETDDEPDGCPSVSAPMFTEFESELGGRI